MKMVHRNLAASDKLVDLLSEAKQLESQGELQKAIAMYERLIKKNPVNENAYNRLMIIYRKQKEYKKEMTVINAGIKSFQQFYKSALKLPADRKIKALSNALLKATGLADQKGKLLYEREPIGHWNKRRELVSKKLRK
ncbi:MAG: hypothetical protein ABI675_27100 [Chitinophagaceae bacterium]